MKNDFRSRSHPAWWAFLVHRLSGLAQPTYVLDIPGGVAKVPILPNYLESDGTVRDPSGTAHPNPEMR